MKKPKQIKFLQVSSTIVKIVKSWHSVPGFSLYYYPPTPNHRSFCAIDRFFGELPRWFPTFPTTEKEETKMCFLSISSLLNAQRQRRRKQPIFLIIHVTMFALFIRSFFSIIKGDVLFLILQPPPRPSPSAVLYHLCKVVSHCNDQTNDLLPTFGADKTNTGRDAHDGLWGWGGLYTKTRPITFT